MRYLFYAMCITLFFGCSTKQTNALPQVQQEPKRDELNISIAPKKEVCFENEIKIDSNITKHEKKEPLEILDLVNIPQNAAYFLQNVETVFDTSGFWKNYKDSYFKAWRYSKPPHDEKFAKWPFELYFFGDGYGENLKLLNSDFFTLMYENFNFKEYGNVSKKALTLSHVNLRIFPTIKPYFKNPSTSGEGYPFDYLQNSAIFANEPIFISHYSKDREWAYIFTSYASGWIKRSEFKILDKKHSDFFQKSQQVWITKEGESLHSQSGEFLFKSKVGMVFALVGEDRESFLAVTAHGCKESTTPFVKLKIPKNIATKENLLFTSQNIISTINEVSKTNYGWGGFCEQRDCSSTLRDFFAPFGIWLPRNSYEQSMVGKSIKLDTLSDEEKIEIIKQKAIPFRTFLYKKGHILLYVGVKEGEIVVFHNVWGVKTKTNGIQGRVIIGKPVFSTLRLGKEQRDYDKDSEIVKNLTKMSILN